MEKNKRILWLLNHATLRGAEVPMLLRMGYEVFIPKIIPFDEANASASVTYLHDDALSIPPEFLKILNKFDFYTKSWPNSLKREINKYFGNAIVPIFPSMVNAVCDSFEGQVFLRVFGLDGDGTYANLFEENLSGKAIEKIKNGDSVWITTNIAPVIDNEPKWLRRQFIYLPAGLPGDLYRQQDQWHGKQKKIFFVCPRINSNPYYTNVYRDFKKLFGDLPYSIAGAQFGKISNDPSITGYLEQDEYSELFKSHRLMYYHSQEERHLHYHPLEAILYGMPLIFMAGGVLEYLARKKLPGCCSTPEEARIKVQRILNGDTTFTDEVIASQKIILHEFDTKHVEDVWRRSFIPSISTEHDKLASKDIVNPPSEIKHIGLWMHETSPNGFTGEGISRLQAMIVRGAQEHPDLQIHLAAVSWVKNAIIGYMSDLGVDTRRLSFVLVDEKPPLIFQLYNAWINRKPREKLKWSVPDRLLKFVRDLKSQLSLRFASLRFGIGTFIAFLLAAPLLIVLGILFILLRILQKILEKLIVLLRIDRLTSFVRSQFNWAKGNLFALAPRLYRLMTEAEFALLAKKVGHDKKFSAWFFAYPINKYLSHFNSPKIVAVPDIVFIDFPGKYSREVDGLMENYFSFIQQTVCNADAVITFSEYVRQNHVIKPGYQSEENVTVVRHAPIETRSLITSRPAVDDDELHLLARRVIRNYLSKQTQTRGDKDANYLQSLNLGEIDYLFVSSQSRLHKNHLNLLKAHRFLLREKYMDLKLVFTGQFSDEMQEYITQERLHLDVLSMHYMPPVVHASFYACAKLTVVPTLFEGGFPFVFSESLSVNTPVVMSDIPVVREVLSDDERDLFCFDPYDTQDMSNKIMRALENHSALLSAQELIFEQMQTRTWKDVAEEYIRVFIETKQRKDRNDYSQSL